VPTSLILLQRFVRNQGDAWQWSIDYLERAIEDWQVAGDASRREEIAAGYATLSLRVGQRLGQLHAHLAAATSPAFLPRRIDRDRAHEVRERVAASLSATRDALATASSAGLPPPDPQMFVSLDAQLTAASASLVGSLETRIHGDFHLGQILISSDDVYIVDFEGEPAAPLAERRRLASPLQDVAGFLRSLHYADASTRLAHPLESADAATQECLGALRARAETTFLAAYAHELAQAAVPWTDAGTLVTALPLYLISKAAYEVRYELANRPAWLPISVAGLTHLASPA
jgi:maltose alpha-D-glucosyltransferase/alpha-amylase